jgi:dTDP-glucose pyrophosphorylase
MWGIIPAAGNGTRIQPLAFSKELLPVGDRDDARRPKAVSEYLVERLAAGGADKLCFVISPGKSDILRYYGGRIGRSDVAYVVQPKAAGLCDAIFRARVLVAPSEDVAVGLPDTIWFPRDALARLPPDCLAFLLFPVDHPELFDAVETDPSGNVTQIQVKEPDACSNWVWGAFRMPGKVFHELYQFWHERGERDVYVGTLINAWLARGGHAVGVRAGERYFDVGTLDGYREAIQVLGRAKVAPPTRSIPLQGV